MNITICITVKNRTKLVQLCARSIQNLNNLECINILILNDSSTEFTSNFLIDIFPKKSRIINNVIPSGGADFALFQILSEAINLESDYYLVLDSDMLIRSDFLNIIQNTVHFTDGIFSLFNTESHETLEIKELVRQKSSIGAAGTVFNHDILKKILLNIKAGPSFDFRYCEFLKQSGTKIYCLNQSAVQHLGYLYGQNSTVVKGDFGNNFFDNDFYNAYLMIEFLFTENRKIQNVFEEQKLYNRIKKIEKYFRLKIKKLVKI